MVAAIALSACGGLGEVKPVGNANTETGGAVSTGGTPDTGGETGKTTVIGTGGVAGTGGTPGTGGALGTGGASSSGTATSPGTTVYAVDAGMAAIGGSSSDPPPPLYLPGDGTAVGATGSKGTTPTTTTTTPIDAGPPIQAGQLTAGTWDDNLNFSFYSTYLSSSAQTQLPGMPLIERANRMVILVRSADAQPVAGATVGVSDGQGHDWTSTTGAEGRVIYFPEWAAVAPGASVTVTASLANLRVATATTAAAGTIELDFAQTALPTITALDLAFVIDTTGSMGDELSYVQSELDHIVGGITTQFPGINQRWALIAYRDLGDEYVVLSFDFTTDLASFRANLAARKALNGGDMPEAVDQALAATTQLGWRDGATARVAFWIADAPHHVGLENKVVAALGAAVAKGIHIYPVAASGIDDLGEFTMRTAAEVTGGRYLFLTNDSGIGGSHAEPHIPCYYVTILESAMRRMVATEVLGVYQPPQPADILRTGGDPQNQQCLLSSGQPVTAW